MIGKSLRVSAACLALLVATAPAAEPPPPYGLDWQVLRFDSDQFTVRLPPEWLQIPVFNMERFVGGAAASSFIADKTYAQNYRHGFQEGPVKEWFRPPYCLVDVHTRGRVTREQLADLPRVGQILPDGGPLREDGSRGVFSQTTIGTFTYEPEADIVWLNFSRPREGADPMRAAAALILTQQGGIQLNFYCREADAHRYLDLFERVARTVQIHDYIRYRKPILESWPIFESMDWSNPTMRYIEISLGAAFLFGLATLCWVLKKRAEADEANPLNPLDEE